MAEVNANIGVQIDTSQALAQLKNLQREISLFHTSIAKSSATAAAAQRNLQTDFLNAINATGKFAAEFRTIKTASESFTNSLEKNKFSMREYFRYAGAATKSFGSLFKNEFDTINKVAEDRVKRLQTQYIKMGRDANGALKAISVTPLALDMNNLHTQTMIAAQRQQLFNELLSKGTTNLINFGKNTQWAGRQLMVGFSVPLSIFGSQATKIFMDIEQQALRFKRVYGDLFTSKSETDANLLAIRSLAQEYTKYGVAIKDTMSLAADAAAAGLQGNQLQETVRQATKLSVLGEVDKQQAFQATISLQTAFKMSNEELAQSVDFLNAVENQSVTSLQDMTDAIPKVAPVIRGLGGDVKDMAVFLTAMKEGGVDAAEAANGLKSALASMINPTKAAKEMLAGVGINIQEITTRNKGNVMRTVLELGDALKGLEPMARTQVLEKLFGKYQFARVSALFDNISKSGSQAQRTMELMSMSASDLARISNKELTSIEENAAVKFKASVESLKNSLAPVGETFLKIITPIIEFITKVADKFSGLSDHTKKVIAVIVTVIGGIAPVVLMLVGLFANFFGQMMKFFAMLRSGYLGITGQSKVLGEQMQYQTTEMQDAAAVAHSLDQIHAKLTQRFTVEADAVAALAQTYAGATAAAQRFAAANPGMLIPGMRQSKKMSKGGLVPGSGNTDSVPTMLTPGEFVVPKNIVSQFSSELSGMISGRMPSNATGTNAKTIGTVLGGTFASKSYSPIAMMAPGNAPGGFGMDKEWLKFNKEAGASFAASLKTVGMLESDIKATQSNYSKFWNGLSPVLDDLFGIFQGGITDDVTNISQVGKSQYPLIVQHIKDLEKSSKITAQESEQLQNATRKLLSPLEGDLTQQNIQRIELAQNESGQSFVKRASTERFGKTYKPQVRSNFLKELNLRGLAQPANYKDEYQFAHIPESQKTMRFIPPFLRKKAGAGNALEQQVMAMAASGMIIKEGDIINASGKVVDAAQVSVKNRQKSQSPSKVAKQLALDFGSGYREGLAESVPGIQAEGAAIADAAAGGASGGGTGGGSTGGTTGGSSGRSGRFGKRFGAVASKLKGVRPAGAMMGMSGAVLGASMIPGGVGDFAQKLIPATMGLQALSIALPLLTNPIGATVAALGGLAFLIHKANKAYEEHIQAIKDSAKAEVARKYGSSTGAQDYAKFSGQGLPSNQQFNRVGSVRFISADLAKQQGFKEFYDQKGNVSTKAIMGAKAQDKAGAIAADIANRAAIFGLGPKDIAANIKAASAMVGANEFQVKAKLQELLAPGGKDILTTPLTVDARINFLKSTSDKQLQDLKTRIGKLGSEQLPAYGGNRAGAGQYAAQQQKIKEKEVRDSAIASELLKKSFSDQTQALAMLNQQYVNGTITQQQYNTQFEILRANMDKVAQSTKELVSKFNLIDKSGKTSKALLSDMADTVLGSFKDLGKETTKIVKESLSKMPSKVQTSIMIGLAAGSLQPTDIIIMSDILERMKGKTVVEKLKILNESKNGLMQPVIDQITLTILAQQKLDKVMEISKAKAEGASGSALRGLQVQLDSINAQITATEKRIKDGEKVVPPTNEPTGTTGLGDTGSGAQQESSVLDSIVAKFRDLDKANQKLTEGWTKSKAALNNIFKGIKPGLGLEEVIRSKGGGEDLINLILGMSPTDFEKHKKELFNFDKAGKNILSLTGFAKNLGNVMKQLSFSGLEQSLQATSRDTINQSAAIRKLTASGIAYEDALKMVQGQSSQTLDALANTNMADAAWQHMIKTVKDLNKAMMEGSIEYALQSKIDSANVGLNYISTEADALRAQAAAGLAQDQEAVDSLQRKINALQKDIEMQYDRPIEALQSKSNILNNDLTKISKKEEAINEQFDNQQKALENISKINQQILAQDKSKLTLADAITQGDMSAVASAMQDMRAQNASSSMESQQSALDAARQNALNNITENGKTRKQIEDALYSIGQQIFALEQQKETVLKNQLTPLQDQLYTAQQKLEQDQLMLQKAIDTLTYNGQSATALELQKANAALALLEYQKVATSAGKTAASAQAADTAIKSYASTLNSLKDRTITITEIHNVIYNYSSSGSPNAKQAFGGFVKKMAGGGIVGGNGILDTVPTMLTPGEFVVNRKAAKQYAPLLQSINGQSYPAMQGRIGSGSTVSSAQGGRYSSATSNNLNNYQLNVHLNGSNMDAEQVANTVIRKIKLMERNNIRRSTI